MKYELLTQTPEGENIYARIEDDGKCYVTCSEDNPEYQAWLAEQTLPTLPAEGDIQ